VVVWQAYDNYSFEELRYASPAVRRATENMLIRDNDNGTYTASWTPATSGLYDIQVRLDDINTGESVSRTQLLHRCSAAADNSCK